MCGIVGYAGSKQAAPILLDGLSRLEYRGYDSAGLCVFSEGELKLAKSKGRLAVLRTKTENGATLPGYLGIGHTRWATHGAPSDENAHPQLSTNGSICIVHNGIIENFLPLKEFLLKQGKTFRSETDTEVIANLLEYYYEQENDLMKAVRLTLGRIEGSYALGILCADRPDSMIAVKKDSPLIFGFGEGENFIASDVPAILPYTRSVVYLNDGDMVVFTKNAAQFYDANGTPVRKAPEHIEWEMSAAQKGGYPHFMLKEIYDQPKALRDTINPRIRNGRVVLDDVKLDESYLRGLRRIYMVACGSASYVGNHAKYILERTTRIQVEPVLASEFRYSEPVLGDDTLVIIISQSGETADTLAALREANARGARTLAIVNVVGSAISKAAHDVIYTCAGPEIAVATTKAYSTQLAVIYLLAMYIGEKLGTLAVLHSLVRTRSGAYPLDRCRSFEDCERAMADGTMQQLLLPTDSLFTDCPAVALTAEGAERIARGAVVFPRQTDSLPETAGTLCRVYHEGRFLMLGQVRELDKGGLGLFVYKNFR